jgi:LmbE family N-acetylglucosaminyl deacetylase
LGSLAIRHRKVKAAVTMLPLRFAKTGDRPLHVLCLGSHSDDIEIGCGGTILRLLEEYDAVCAHWVVFAANSERRDEAEKSAGLFLAKASRKDIIVKNFRESFFPYTADEIKGYFESLKQEVSPDVVFTHYRHDLHQDHRLVSELTWNTFRNHFILEYEVIKYDGDLGSPNFFVHLEEAVCKKKIALVVDSFKSQAQKDWFTPDAFWSVLRIRGIESKASGNYAEGFYCRKLVF